MAVRRTDPVLWKRTVARVKRGSKGGRAGEWSARKAQLAVFEYKKAGGGYKGPKTGSNSLVKWTRQKWRTKSGKPSVVGKKATGERYLPSKAIKSLSKAEYAATTRAKRRDLRKGKQFSAQPTRVAKKTAGFRKSER